MSTAPVQHEPVKTDSLQALFDKRQLALDPVALITYEVDAGYDRGRPDGVFYPESTADVSRIMQWAAETGVPLVARGAGTGLSGGAVAEHGGIIIEFARMNHVLELDTTGRSAAVEVGVVNLAFDNLVKQAGLYYPPDPSSGRSSVIGGNLGMNAGGPHCFKYGVTTNYITGLEVVLADGRVVQVGGRALDYPGYDLCGILVGSEGTLGIATRADLRLIRNPPGVKTMMIAFDSEEQAGKAVSAVIAAGLVPATLEMMDQRFMRIIEAYAPVGLPIDAQAALIVEVDGYPAGLDAQMEEIADILTTNGGFDLRIAQSEAERAQIWYGRKSAAGSLSRLAPNFYLVDITVPRSRLADTLAAVNAVCDRYQLTVGHVFHAGDGNLHPAIAFDARDEAVKAQVFQACAEIVAICLERDGSITGEHGVGIEKRPYMSLMYSGAELSAMLAIKRLFDPQGLLNPGKIFPPEVPPAETAGPVEPTARVIAPATVEEAAAVLAGLSQARQSVRISGAPPDTVTSVDDGAEHVLSTANFRGVKTFAADDLYVTVGAGTPVAALQAYLAERRFQCALSSPWADATVGGLVAANVNGPQRLRYGGLRDNVLCTTVALADGRVIRAGRPVVKNVAGYDLPKLFIGSYGTLGVMTDVTLKLTPLPRARRTYGLPVQDVAAGVAWAAATVPHWLITSGVLLCAEPSGDAPYSLRFTLEGVAEDIDAEWAEMAEALGQVGAPVASENETSASERWCDFVGAGMSAVRVGLPPGKAAAYLGQVEKATFDQATWCFDLGNSLVYVALDGSQPMTPQWLAALRTPAEALGGYALVMDGPHAALPDAQLDRWGAAMGGRDLMAGIKAAWDPAQVLSPDTFGFESCRV